MNYLVLVNAAYLSCATSAEATKLAEKLANEAEGIVEVLEARVLARWCPEEFASIDKPEALLNEAGVCEGRSDEV